MQFFLGFMQKITPLREKRSGNPPNQVSPFLSLEAKFTFCPTLRASVDWGSYKSESLPSIFMRFNSQSCPNAEEICILKPDPLPIEKLKFILQIFFLKLEPSISLFVRSSVLSFELGSSSLKFFRRIRVRFEFA